MLLVTFSGLLSNADLPDRFVAAAEDSFLRFVLNLSPRSLVDVPLFFGCKRHNK